MTIDTTNMCSHLQRKLFSPDGEYRAIREQIESDPTLTAVVRSRQLHIYRDGQLYIRYNGTMYNVQGGKVK